MPDAPATPDAGPQNLKNSIGIIVSLLVVLPLFCMPRLLAGDLPSHLYNAWLADQIHDGKVAGLAISSQTSNITADVALSVLLRLTNIFVAEHVVAALTILVLFWGAFRFVRAVSGRGPLWLAPLLAVLTYGFVFQMGLLNFCLALGFCFFLFAQLLKEKKDWVAIVCLVALAWMSHPLPLLWLAGSLAFYWIAERSNWLYRALLLAAAALALGVINHFMVTRLFAGWLPHGWMEMSGAWQLEIFGQPYHWLAFGYVAFSAVLLGITFFTRPRPPRLGHIVCFFLLQAIAVFLLPYQAAVPDTPASFDLITARFSLIAGVAFLAVLNVSAAWKPLRGAVALLAIVYFVLLVRDIRTLDSRSSDLDAAVRRLPANSRVLLRGMGPPRGGQVPIHFMLERSCIGHCYAYANFEPSTGHFRVRAVAPNPYVIENNLEVAALNNGSHALREFEEPLYVISPCAADPKKICLSEY